MVDDKELKKIPIRENGEELIDIKENCSDVVISEYHRNERIPNRRLHGRKSAVKKLCEARDHLPDGYTFIIYQAYRPLEIQRKCYNHFYNKNREEHPEWSEEKVKEETDRFVAPPEGNPPHTTGGAFDLSILDSNGKELDMGSDVHDADECSNTDNENISEKAKENRKLLIDVMEKAGLVNYPEEWWHWCYGDSMWAYYKNEEYAIYGSL